jgi:cytochrome c peroxidase
MIARPKPRWTVPLVALALTGCGKYADEVFCSDAACEWTDLQWARLQSLANPGPPDGDPSNIYWNSTAARDLGKLFYFDTGFSGSATQTDATFSAPCAGPVHASPPARQPTTQPDGTTPGPPINVSCATCHDSTRGGADYTSVPGNVSVGAGWTDVNALTNTNAAYRKVLFWNGRMDSLWGLNVVVLESNTTMNGNRLALVHRIFDKYRSDYEKVFGPLDPEIGTNATRFPPSGKPKSPVACAPDGIWEAKGSDQMPLVAQMTVNTVLVNWAKAIAAYEYELISVDSPFDQFVRAGKDSNLISGAARRGARLFVDKAACIDCHSGPQLTDEDFHNIGVTQIGLGVPTTSLCPDAADDPYVCDCHEGPRCPPWGAKEGLYRLQSEPRTKTWLRSGAYSNDMTDASRADYTGRALTPDLKGAWRTPSLRNVALTAPYMHDGSMATLADVVWHYSTGGRGESGERIGDPVAQVKPINLTDDEVSDLVAFLETLTGDPVPTDVTSPPPPR